MNTFAPQNFVVKDEFELIRSATDYSLERDQGGWISGQFYRCRLTSAFQPIIDMAQNKTIGHTAHIRSESDGEISLSPWQVFAQATNDEQLVHLDRLCRAVHALNYFNNKATRSDEKLFVGVHPLLLETVKVDHGRAFEDFLNLIGVKTSRVTIEIPPTINHNRELLQKVINNYHLRGYAIAVTYHSGSNNAWMPELGSLYPEIIRIKASYLLNYRVIDAIIKAVHHLGSKVLVWDIGTFEQLTTAKRLGADYLQGHFLSEPVRAIHTISPRLIQEILNPNLTQTPEEARKFESKREYK
ncbi:EAL domain-containing protein [Nitrosomonas communis]|uniref:EAL domain, c-di-GMP-specific phosphodiesterase class I (Or its enzymatically inactive variant) n=1 Tax=Nitrosomonas communis TaxID=44574 RepID=A0A1H2QZ01_9PROT|nr:EAL domain-containing protein [Nitrosomonas communis]SDW11874.1 EAL domain, c-di-GMP-specific phosphodiesterase class I (or its enzymatically inactive variant) [Nitrosomonas communis]